ncbi:MAG: SCP2 sterol-binding domain-containing protein [Clostridia bacterium]|nr:SCP2 sterol-binding domain-containing protein [Clostridia bacterium]
MTFIEKYDYLKKKYAAKADTAKFRDAFIAAQITMSDEDCGGTMYAAYIDGNFSFEPYDYHDNTVAIIINSALLEECIKGKADPVKAYLDGQLQAWGNLDHALQLIDVLKGKKRVCRKKTEEAAAVCGEAKEEAAPEKKAAKKKAEVKKAAEVKAEEITAPAPKKRACKKKTAEKE